MPGRKSTAERRAPPEVARLEVEFSINVRRTHVGSIYIDTAQDVRDDEGVRNEFSQMNPYKKIAIFFNSFHSFYQFQKSNRFVKFRFLFLDFLLKKFTEMFQGVVTNKWIEKLSKNIKNLTANFVSFF